LYGEKMHPTKLQKGSGGQLYVYIPKFIQRHFNLKHGQPIWIDIEENKIVIHLEK